MRVLFLISSAGFYGAEAAVANVAVGLRRRGCEVVIGSLRQAGGPETGFEPRMRDFGLEVETIRCAGKVDSEGARQLRETLRRRSIDVLHTHGYKADLYGYWASRGSFARLVATCHNWTGETLRVRFYDLVDHIILRRFPRIAAVSGAVRASLRRFGVREERIRVIPNGVDCARFVPGERRDLGSAARGPVIGFVGRLADGKGVDLLLESAPAVLRQHPGAEIVIVGDGPARAGLEALARRSGVSGSVRFLGTRRDIEAVYAGLDILVLPSRNEGAPMVVLEAMASGRPVLATRVGALPNIVEDGQTGILVEPNDRAAIERGLLHLLADEGRLARMGARARGVAEARFSCDAMAARYLDLYESAAAARVA